MSKQKIIQTNWTSGEVSPLMLGRVDTTKYQNGAAQLLNFVVRKQGSLWKRAGTKFMGLVKNAVGGGAANTMIREFDFNDTQTYQLEFGNLYVRFWFNYGFVETVPGNGLPLTVATPYLYTDLPLLKFAQSADVLFITHPNYQTQMLERLGANSWSIVPYVNEDGPYLAKSSAPIPATLTISNMSRIAAATSLSALFGSSSKNITNITNSGGLIKLTSVGHGFSTGNNVNVTGIYYTSIFFNKNYLAPFPNGNGNYNITVVDANSFTLNGSGFASGIYTYVLAGQVALFGQGGYVEYKDQNNDWAIARILTVLSSTSANVSPFPGVKNNISPYTIISYTTTNGGAQPCITASNSGVFLATDSGSYVRTTAGAWYQITYVASDSLAYVGSILTLTSYSYPSNIVFVPPSNVIDPTLDDTQSVVVTCDVNSSSAIFASTDVGRHLRLNYGGSQPWGIIISYNSSTHVKLRLYGQIPVDPSQVYTFYGGGATNDWRLGAWSATTGWPSVAVFHEQRLWLMSSPTEPQGIWGSQPDDYPNHAPTEYDSLVLDTSAISYTIVSNKANPILWADSGPVLLVGTLGGEWKIQSASAVNGPITPTSIVVTPQTTHGGLNTSRAFRIGYATIFAQRAATKLIELTYQFTIDSYVGADLNIVSDHILRQGGGVIDLAYQQEPTSILWARLTDGTLAALTYEKEQQVLAWHRHILGGTGPQPIVESFCVSSTVDGTHDVLYLVVNRSIAGVPTRCLEYLTPDYYPVGGSASGAMYLDCASTYSGTPATNIAGLVYLQGEAVSVVADGKYIGEKIVSNTGQVTLAKAASVVSLGYKYNGLCQVLPLEGGSPTGGTAQGKVKRTGRTMFRLLSSASFQYGMVLSKMDVATMTDDTGFYSNTGLFTGDKVVSMPAPYNYTQMFYFQQPDPLPLIVLAVAPDVEVTQ